MPTTVSPEYNIQLCQRVTNCTKKEKAGSIAFCRIASVKVPNKRTGRISKAQVKGQGN